MCPYRCWVDPIGAPDKRGSFAQMWIRPDGHAPQPRQLRRFSAFFSVTHEAVAPRSLVPGSCSRAAVRPHAALIPGGATRWVNVCRGVRCRLLPSKNNLQRLPARAAPSGRLRHQRSGVFCSPERRFHAAAPERFDHVFKKSSWMIDFCLVCNKTIETLRSHADCFPCRARHLVVTLVWCTSCGGAGPQERGHSGIFQN